MEKKIVDGWEFTTNSFTQHWEKDLNGWNACYGTSVKRYKVYQLTKGFQKIYAVYESNRAIIAQDSIEAMDLFISMYKEDRKEDFNLLSLAER